MMHAPEMSPTLDDALRALDGASVNGVINAAQLAAVRGFLEQLDDVRDVAPVLANGRALAEHLEGAYLAGVRCADESGHVLVMSLPAFLAMCPPPAPVARRDGALARFADWFAARILRRPFAYMAAGFALAALVSALVDHDAEVAAWLAFGAAGWGLLEYVVAPMFKPDGAKTHAS
jgi:hypothetical protein